MLQEKTKPKFKVITLESRFGIILPKTGNNGEDYTEKIKEVAKIFADKFGGSSVQNLLGYWIGENKTYIDENVIVYAYADYIDYTFIEKIVLNAKRDFNQEAIAYELNGKLHITV